MSVKSISALTLKFWIENREVVLIDVREAYENKAYRIESATLIPLGEIDVSKLPEINHQKLVIHCKSGIRSSIACEKLLAQDPSLDIYNLEGGIEDWKNHGFQVLTN
ncbi:MAG: Rhodanese domain protein [Rickettsiaceae bacterium]|jgi:rhodanese-related sulfurtransferase|nr:Rhodanese domain protein [Rickettsiaceae bacterium]